MELTCPHCRQTVERPDDILLQQIDCPRCGGTIQFGDLPTMAPAPAARPTVSSSLENRHLGGYRLTQLIGRGGMGEVYEAIQESLNRRVAVKVLPPHLEADPAFVKRFNRESGALAQLSHPHIVGIYDRGHSDGHYFFVLEYVDGADGKPAATLQDRLRVGVPLAVGECSHLIQQVAEALAYAHCKGVIHRDIKPSNVLLDARGNARLADFGIAHIAGGDGAQGVGLTMTGEVLGTAGYVAPEQRDGKKGVDGRADIYSCGVLLYQMLTGGLPEGVFELPSEAVPELGNAWDAVVEKALQRNPDRRYQTMGEFLNAICSATASSPADARQVAVPPAPAKVAQPPTESRLTPVVGQCAQCKAVNPGDNRFCSECGTLLFEICLSCKAENRVGTKYCGKCGADIAKLKRVEGFRQSARALVAQATGAVSKEASELMSKALKELDSLLKEVPKDAEATRQKEELQTKYCAFRRAEAGDLVEQAQREANFSKRLSLLKQARALLTQLLAEYPSDNEGGTRCAEVEERMRTAYLERAQSQLPGEATRTYREILETFPQDSQARAELDRLEKELASLQEQAGRLVSQGHFREALETLENGLKSYPGDNKLQGLQRQAKSNQSKLVDLAEERIPRLWRDRKYVEMRHLLDELRGLRADLEGIAEARDATEAALQQAMSLTSSGNRLFAARQPQQALAEYHQALETCADYAPAAKAIQQCEVAIARAAKARRFALVTGLVVMVVGLVGLAIFITSAIADYRAWDLTRQAAAAAGKDDARIEQLYKEYLGKRPKGRGADTARRAITRIDEARLAEQERQKRLAEEGRQGQLAEQERQRQAKISALLATARANDSKKTRGTALLALDELLKLEPQHLVALKLREKIRRYYKNSPWENSPWENSLWMQFEPVPGTEVLFSIWETRVQDYQAFVTATGKSWEKPLFQQGLTHPAVLVSWENAKAFCAWLTEKERREGRLEANQEYRLPTDAEWSVAAGLGRENGSTPAEKDEKTKDVYPWGRQWPPPAGVGNYSSSLKVDDYDYTSPVGSFPANQFGLYDMGGNVWEWCEDPYKVWEQPRVLRGGSWASQGHDNLQSSYRCSDNPDARDGLSGFRSVLVVGSSSSR